MMNDREKVKLSEVKGKDAEFVARVEVKAGALLLLPLLETRTT